MKSLHQDSCIAVVDDQPSVGCALVHLLRSHGFAAIRWSCGRTFLEEAKLPTLSCLILDVQMPGLDGWAVHERLTEAGHRFPVIFFTGAATHANALRAERAGAFAFLEKPGDLVRLVAAIHRAHSPDRNGDQPKSGSARACSGRGSSLNSR